MAWITRRSGDRVALPCAYNPAGRILKRLVAAGMIIWPPCFQGNGRNAWTPDIFVVEFANHRWSARGLISAAVCRQAFFGQWLQARSGQSRRSSWQGIPEPVRPGHTRPIKWQSTKLTDRSVSFFFLPFLSSVLKSQ